MPQDDLVLLIEDNEDFQNLFAMVAAQAGYSVEKIFDGKEALLRFEHGPLPNLVLLDALLPFADGDTLLAAIRSNHNWQHVPVYMLTADARVVKKYQAYQPSSPQPDGVIEKGAEAIHKLRELFNQYKK